MHIIQLGLLTDDDSAAYVEIGGQWLKVPYWLWCEWEFSYSINGLHGEITFPGIFGIIKYYRLDDIPFREHEAAAVYNIAKQGRAMRQYWLYGDVGTLGQLEHLALKTERYVMERDPHLRGQAFYERVAGLMGNGVSWRQAKGIIDDATAALVQKNEGHETTYFEKLARRIEKLNQKAA